MTYNIANFASLDLLWKLLKVKFADAPDAGGVDIVQTALTAALAGIIAGPSRGLESRLGVPLRSTPSEVRERLCKQWNAQLEGT